MWSYVGSEDANGIAVVPIYYSEGLMIDEHLRAFFWSGEDVLEEFLRGEDFELKPENRLFIASMIRIENEEFQVSINALWNYTDEEISYDIADWDSIRLMYDAERGLIIFIDWLGVRHLYMRASNS